MQFYFSTLLKRRSLGLAIATTIGALSVLALVITLRTKPPSSMKGVLVWLVIVLGEVTLIKMMANESLEFCKLIWRTIKGERGELEIGKVLQQLPPHFITVPNVLIQRGGNIDFVVIGPTGVFVIEAKTTRMERITYPDKQYINQVIREATELFNMIQSTLGVNQWVNALLVYANDNLLIEMKNRETKQHVTILTKLELVPHILSQSQRISQEQIQSLADTIKKHGSN